jgi:hypothetical protein
MLASRRLSVMLPGDFLNCLHVVGRVAAAPPVTGGITGFYPAGRVRAVGAACNLRSNGHTVQVFDLPDVMQSAAALAGIRNHIEYDPSRRHLIGADPGGISRSAIGQRRCGGKRWRLRS